MPGGDVFAGLVFPPGVVSSADVSAAPGGAGVIGLAASGAGIPRALSRIVDQVGCSAPEAVQAGRIVDQQDFFTGRPE